MLALVTRQIDEDIGVNNFSDFKVDIISSTLQQRCPSICEPNDVILYKGMEFLRTAKFSSSKDQQQYCLKESIEYNLANF